MVSATSVNRIEIGYDLKTSLEQFASARSKLLEHYSPGVQVPAEFKYASPEDVVIQHGVQPVAKVAAPWRGQPKQCFYNAATYVLSHAREKCWYTEGYYASVFPVHHAWVTLEDGTIFDPTLDRRYEDDHTFYLGVTFEREWWDEHIIDGSPCVMVNQHEMINLDILRGDFKLEPKFHG